MTTSTGVGELHDLEELQKRSHPIRGVVALIVGVIGLIVAIGLSISFGATDISLGTVWTAVTHFSPELTTHQIIHDIRLPRVLGAALVGASFAVAGAIMQGMTRNPLADSGLLGLNSGLPLC